MMFKLIKPLHKLAGTPPCQGLKPFLVHNNYQTPSVVSDSPFSRSGLQKLKLAKLIIDPCNFFISEPEIGCFCIFLNLFR
jgi:hypothetical protein